LYDSVTKFLFETFSEDYATWLLGRPIALTKLEPSELSLEPIRADSLIFLEGEDLILHIESQTQPQEELFFRLLDYRVRLYRRSPLKPVKQVVIYLTQTRSSLVYQTSFAIPGTRHEFEVIRLWEQPVELFLNRPGLLPLAPLARTADREQTLRQVAETIDGIGDRTYQSTIAASTAILSGLVLNKGLIKQILRRDIMRESPIYQEILEEGKQAGRLEGRQEGRLEGSQERARIIARNLLSIGMTPEQVATATGLTIEEVEELQANP
jgi:predicted transposase/invertase (TIGR01784 family)